MIREMQKDDIKRVMDIWLSASILAHDFIGYDFWCCRVSKLLEELSKATAYVFFDEGIVLGFISLVRHGQCAYVQELFVDPRFQGKGLGSELPDQVKGQFSSVDLHAYEKDTRAREFYVKHGFHACGGKTEQETGERKIKMRWRKDRKASMQ